MIYRNPFTITFAVNPVCIYQSHQRLAEACVCTLSTRVCGMDHVGHHYAHVILCRQTLPSRQITPGRNYLQKYHPSKPLGSTLPVLRVNSSNFRRSGHLMMKRQNCCHCLQYALFIGRLYRDNIFHIFLSRDMFFFFFLLFHVTSFSILI